MFNEFGNRHYNHFYNLALGGHVDFPVDQNDFTSLTEWTTSYPEWHKKCLEKVNQSATIEVKINVEQVMMATKEPRLSVSDILASIGKFILFSVAIKITPVKNQNIYRWTCRTFLRNEHSKLSGDVVLAWKVCSCLHNKSHQRSRKDNHY